MAISIITSNASAEFLTPPGVPPWEQRKWLYVQVLRDAQPTIIGLQEVIPSQLQFIQGQLTGLAALTVPVNDPDPDLVATWQAKYARFGLLQIPNPYEVALFYRTDALELLETGHWWLSPTPLRPSIGFGNTAPRVVLWAHVRHRASERQILVFNTHIDHRCTRAMVDLCRQEMAELTGRASLRIFMGDMNFNPSTPEYELLRADGWRDSHEAAAGNEEATFLYDMPDIPGGRIDHILYQGDGLAPQTWSRLQSPDPERRVSDHDPVCVRFWMDDASQNDRLADYL